MGTQQETYYLSRFTVFTQHKQDLHSYTINKENNILHRAFELFAHISLTYIPFQSITVRLWVIKNPCRDGPCVKEKDLFCSTKNSHYVARTIATRLHSQKQPFFLLQNTLHLSLAERE